MRRVDSRENAQKTQECNVGPTHHEMAGDGPPPGGGDADSAKKDDDVIDGEFEVKK